MKKYLKSLIAVMPPLAAFAVQLIASLVLTMIYSGIISVKAGLEQASGVTSALDLTNNLTEALTEEITYLFSVLAVMISGIVFIFWYRREIFGEIRGKLKNVVNIKNISKFLCLALGCQLFVSGILSLLTEYFPKAFDQYEATINNILSGSPIVVIIVTIIIAPITEELIFRGVTLHLANRHIPFFAANALQSVLFGIYHGNLIQGIYAAGLGFILGLIYQKFRTIYAPILLHMMVNASAFLVMIFPETKFSYLIILIIGSILLLASIIMIKPAKVLELQEELKINVNEY